MAYDNDKYIRFDWAAKRLLRDKANFCILEGFISVLLREDIKIDQILESEGNQESYDDKYNRVDIKALNSRGEIIIVEVQITRQLDYLRRILYGVSKAVTEHISKGEDYTRVKKIYSVNILYFNIGEGEDYLYHGTTTFTGVHTHDSLRLRKRDTEGLRCSAPEDIFPEYYLIRVNQFNEVARTPLEEWIRFLKDNAIAPDTTAPGLREAKERLRVMEMSDAERHAYDRHIDNVRSEYGMIRAAEIDGRLNAQKEITLNLLTLGVDMETIRKATGLTEQEVLTIKSSPDKQD